MTFFEMHLIQRS